MVRVYLQEGCGVRAQQHEGDTHVGEQAAMVVGVQTGRTVEVKMRDELPTAGVSNK